MANRKNEKNAQNEIVTGATRAETALDIAALVGSVVPWIGGPVSHVLSGMSLGRKMSRVREVLEHLAQDLSQIKSDVAEKYVRTDEFEDLLEQTLRRVGEERNEEKRRLYGAFLQDAIESPGKPYDEQLRILRTFEALQPDHLRVLKAIAATPDSTPGTMGSPIHTLRKRIPEFDDARIEDLVGELNGLRVTNLTSLKVMMSAHGAADLRHAITKFGSDLLRYIIEPG